MESGKTGTTSNIHTVVSFTKEIKYQYSNLINVLEEIL